MVGVEEFFGTFAGRVWEVLKENGLLTVGEIAKKGAMSREEAMAGLGWLAKEGKIEIIEQGKKKKYRLLE